MARKGRPTLEAISKTRKARKKDYQRMASVAIDALLNHQYDILLTFPNFVKFNKTFPKGILTEHAATTRTYRIKSRKLLDWLYEKGYARCNSAQLMMAQYGISRIISRFDRMFEGAVDNSLDKEEDSGYNSGIVDKERTE